MASPAAIGVNMSVFLTATDFVLVMVAMKNAPVRNPIFYLRSYLKYDDDMPIFEYL